MNISINVTDAIERQLRDAATRLHVPADALAAAAVRDLLGQPAADFDAAAERVLEKNRELYDRLR
jgi:hypothetical protein